jgi:hypothetical protein
MNEDYLWDKSGDADPEIERLENTLGRLRFKRPVEPLPLPLTPRRAFHFNFSPALAAAAAVLLLLLAGGLWLGLRPSHSTGEKNVATTNTAHEEKRNETIVSGARPPIGPEPPTKAQKPEDKKLTASLPASPVVVPDKTPRHYPQRQLMASQRRANVSINSRQEQLASEGAHAKAQLILALHIASDKLNTVQKKIQLDPGT